MPSVSALSRDSNIPVVMDKREKPRNQILTLELGRFQAEIPVKNVRMARVMCDKSSVDIPLCYYVSKHGNKKI
jgi:hypothetical protein